MSILHGFCYTREKGVNMKKIFNKKFVTLFLLALVFVGGFLVKSYADKESGYEIRIGMEVGENKENSTVHPSGRQVAFWKIEDDKMGPWDMMRFAKDCDEMTIAEISKKLGQEARYSAKSKLFYDGKDYDKMTAAMYEKNKGVVKDAVRIKSLEEGLYLIKETDESFKESKAKEKITTRIEYVGKESAPEGVLELDAN